MIINHSMSRMGVRYLLNNYKQNLNIPVWTLVHIDMPNSFLGAFRSGIYELHVRTDLIMLTKKTKDIVRYVYDKSGCWMYSGDSYGVVINIKYYEDLIRII